MHLIPSFPLLFITPLWSHAMLLLLFPSAGIPLFPFSSSLLPASHPVLKHLLSFHHYYFFYPDPLLLFSVTVSWHYVKVLLLMRARVRLWLQGWDDIMSHNLSFTSQRARAGRRLTHQSPCRRTEEFNNLLQPSGFVAERDAQSQVEYGVRWQVILELILQH